MRSIALESALGGMTLSFIGMLIAAFGFLPPVAGAIGQEIIDVIAIINSLRTLWKPAIMSDLGTKKESL
jgi:cation transport ATPase